MFVRRKRARATEALAPRAHSAPIMATRSVFRVRQVISCRERKLACLVPPESTRRSQGIQTGTVKPASPGKSTKIRKAPAQIARSDNTALPEIQTATVKLAGPGENTKTRRQIVLTAASDSTAWPATLKHGARHAQQAENITAPAFAAKRATREHSRLQTTQTALASDALPENGQTRQPCAPRRAAKCAGSVGGQRK